MAKEQKKQKTFAEAVASISQIIKKPLSQDETQKINSILKDIEAPADEKPSQAASSKDPEVTI